MRRHRLRARPGPGTPKSHPRPLRTAQEPANHPRPLRTDQKGSRGRPEETSPGGPKEGSRVPKSGPRGGPSGPKWPPRERSRRGSRGARGGTGEPQERPWGPGQRGKDKRRQEQTKPAPGRTNKLTKGLQVPLSPELLGPYPTYFSCM